jgi:raffinose/stachyose/melibiose transport system permease protein
VYAEAFGGTGTGSFRQGYAAAASMVLFLLVLILGMAANFVVSRRERKYMG